MALTMTNNLLKIAIAIILGFMVRLLSRLTTHVAFIPLADEPLVTTTTSSSSFPVEQKNATQSTISTTDSFKNESIYFVHIGKSGGETIKSILQFGCHTRLNRELQAACFAQLHHSQLSQAVQGYLHCFQQARNSVLPAKATAFMFSLRHPLDRTNSWLDYVHPKHCRLDNPQATRQNCMAKAIIDKEQLLNNRSPKTNWLMQFFVNCQINTMHDWARALKVHLPANRTARTVINNDSTADNSNNSQNEQRTCHELAKTSLVGGQSNIGNLDDVPLAAHLIANIRVNYDLAARRFPKTSIYVIRTEYLWNDLKQLDKYLGGSGVFGEANNGKVVNAKRRHVLETQLSTQSIRLLCCGLKLELLTYRILINKAKNLDPRAKTQTLDRAMTRCSFGSWDDLKSCDP
jgi:hypothetical protein